MKFIPILTEKSLQLAKLGKYSFWVSKNLNKTKIKKLIGEMFAVQVVSVRTMNYKGGIKTNTKRRKVTVPGRKKAIVFLKEGEKIALFETKENKK
ncbi:MAG: 50S ribosomal protein L23 [bacterium]|nr:50S ribosomal protein L23 [bacterium]